MSDETLFAAALALPASERAAFLSANCPDPAVRQQVEELLSAADASNPLDRRPLDVEQTISRTQTPPEPSASVGDRIGPYKLLERIGEGGMGEVWVADQTEPIKRRVALKLIKPGMDSRSVLGRFEAERQALAVMDHPNIAKVYEAGTTPDGRPYFVMELVKGTPITEFADARKLTPRQRLELFVPVCQAIQHAHMKGIIHRDIKPSNVLVALHDETPVPKVIDFGVAKAVGQQLTEKTIYTQYGALVGTPAYMAPEQATFNQLDVDTRADVYALGVLLYELLAGSPPIERDRLKKAALDEVLRMVREEEPPRPSQRLSTADTRATIAAVRGTEPAKLSALMKGELDWIVMKALEKDRTRRYETANGFAADVQRYLAGEPVQAVPPSLGYRVRKFVRKHKGPVLAATFVVAALIAGIAGTTWQMLRADQEATRAKAEEAKVREEQILTQAARDAAEVNLVRSYLRPVGYNSKAPDEAELVAFDDLSEQTEDRIRLLYLREAMRDGSTAIRVARRAERVIQAVIGPSTRRRAAALELLSVTQRDRQADPRSRLCACWLAIELGSDDLPALREGFDTLTHHVRDWQNFIGHLPQRIRPSKRGELAEALLAMLVETDDPDAITFTGRGLEALAPGLDPVAVRKAFDLLLHKLVSAHDRANWSVPASSLAIVSKILAPIDVDACFSKLTAAIKERFPDDEVWKFSDSFDALAERIATSRIETDLAAQRELLGNVRSEDSKRFVLTRLYQLLCRSDKTTDQAELRRLADVSIAIFRKQDLQFFPNAAELLAALAPKIHPTVASAKLHEATNALLKVELATGWFSRAQVASALTTLSPHLDSATAEKGFDGLIAIQKTLSENAVGFDSSQIYHALSALALRLDAQSAVVEFEAVINLLLAENPSGRNDAFVVQGAVAALASKLGPTAAQNGLELLLSMLQKKSHPNWSRTAGAGLSGFGRHLSPDAAAKGFHVILELLRSNDWEKLRSTDVDHEFIRNLIPLAARLDSASVRRYFRELASIIPKVKVWEPLNTVGDVLAVLASRLPPEDGSAEASAAIRMLVDAWPGINEKESDTGSYPSNGFAVLTKQLEPGVACRVLDDFQAHLAKMKDGGMSGRTRVMMSALATRLDPAATSSRFDTVLSVLRMGKNAAWADTLLELALRLDPPARSKLCAQAIPEIVAVTSPERISEDQTSSLVRLLSLVDSVPNTAELLRDPRCVGAWRTAVLNRLGELTNSEPWRAALYVGLTSGSNPSFVLPALSQIDDDYRRSLHFRTVFDATKWIGKHYPEIDLDRPHRSRSPVEK